MTQDRLERIRLLSSRFLELQGLRVAAAGAVLALVVGGYLTTASAPTNDGALVAIGVAFVLMVPVVLSLNGYYEARFGRQVPSLPRKPWRLAGAWFALLIVNWTLNTTIPELPAGTPTLIYVGLASVWLSIRDWPLRAYYLLAAVAVAIGFALSGPVSGVLQPNVTLAVMFLLLGASMVPIGLLDHLLLVRLVREARDSQVAGDAAVRPTTISDNF